VGILVPFQHRFCVGGGADEEGEFAGLNWEIILEEVMARCDGDTRRRV